VTDDAAAPPDRHGRRLPDRCWVPAVGALLLATLFAAALLVRAGGDASLLVHAAPPDTDATLAPGSLTVQDADDGFDGQFFYRLGVSPWSTDEQVAGVTFDLPALRNARWGYGALAWAASGGDADLVPWSLLAVNLAAAAALGAAGGALARSSGRHAAWGLLVVLWPGFAYSLSLDTSELVASALVVAALVAGRRRRWSLVGLALTGAVLVRDTTAVVPFGVAAAGAVAWFAAARPTSRLARLAATGRPTRVEEPSVPDHLPATTTGDTSEQTAHLPATTPRGTAAKPDPTAHVPATTGSSDPVVARRRADAVAQTRADAVAQRWAGSDTPVPVLAAGFVPLVVFGLWQLVQRARFGDLPLTSSGDNNLSAPLRGFVDLLGDAATEPSGETLFRAGFALGVVALLVAAGWSWRRTTAPLTERLAWLPAVAVVVVLNAYLWSGATAFMRAATEAGVLSIALLLAAPPAARRPVSPQATPGRTDPPATPDDREAPRRRAGLLPLLAAGLATGWLLTAAVQLAKLG